MGSTSQITPKQFFGALYQGVGGSFIEIRPLLDSSDPRKKTDESQKLEASARRFFAIEKDGPSKSAEYCLSLQGFHVYFGVGLRAKPGKGTKDNVGCVTAAFADVDFKHVPKDQAIANLRALPFKPSIIVLSGNGAHVYWLLSDPVYQSGLSKLEALNRAILSACGAQVGTQDATRILRVPGTANIKPEYPDPKPITQVVLFEPSRRYSLEAMLASLKVNFPPPSASPPEATQASGGEAPIPPPAGGDPVELQDLQISDVLRKVVLEGLPAYVAYRKETDTPEKFEKRQKENQLSRSEADAHVVSQLLAAGVEDPQIFLIFRDPRNKVGEKYRERRDGDKYLSVTIQKMKAFRAEHPRATNAAERVGRQLDHQFRDDRFEIQKIVKMNYTEPIFLVTTASADVPGPFVTRCSSEDLDCYRKFRHQYLIQNNKFPPPLRQTSWEALVNGVEFEVKKVEEELSSMEAEVRGCLRDWMSQAGTELTEASLQHLPVHDGESEKTYMKLKPFMAYLKSDHIDITKRDVADIIKRHGFSSVMRRVGKTVMRLWESSNGQHPSSTPPKETAQSGELFPHESQL